MNDEWWQTLQLKAFHACCTFTVNTSHIIQSQHITSFKFVLQRIGMSLKTLLVTSPRIFQKLSLWILESIFSPKTNDAHSQWQQTRPVPLPSLLAQRRLAEEQPQQQAGERFIREEMFLLRDPKKLFKTYVA